MATTSAVDVVMPQMGVSVSEGTITKWLKQEGEQIAADEPLLEISTDKVDTEVPSPAAAGAKRGPPGLRTTRPGPGGRAPRRPPGGRPLTPPGPSPGPNPRLRLLQRQRPHRPLRHRQRPSRLRRSPSRSQPGQA